MQQDCNVMVTHSTFCKFFADDKKTLNMYWKHLMRQFCNDNKQFHFCSTQGCEYLFMVQQYSTVQIARCDECKASTCLLCGREGHEPATCNIVKLWEKKSSAESENLQWILANTKPCPKCAKPIEKNQGCNHMKCVHCKHDFCWICLGDWGPHGSSWYNCTKPID